MLLTTNFPLWKSCQSLLLGKATRMGTFKHFIPLSVEYTPIGLIHECIVFILSKIIFGVASKVVEDIKKKIGTWKDGSVGNRTCC